MSSTDTIATTASDPTAVVATAQFLTPVVLGLQALTINAKQAHWHVRGANFVGVHELLDTIAGNAGEFADAAAERIVALGLPLDARVSAVADDALGSGGRYALRVRDGVAECAPTGDPADVHLSRSVLGSLYLGAHRATAFLSYQRRPCSRW